MVWRTHLAKSDSMTISGPSSPEAIRCRAIIEFCGEDDGTVRWACCVAFETAHEVARELRVCVWEF